MHFIPEWLGNGLKQLKRRVVRVVEKPSSSRWVYNDFGTHELSAHTQTTKTVYTFFSFLF